MGIRRSTHAGTLPSIVRSLAAPAHFAATLKGFSAVEQLELVNNFVNHRVQYEEDLKRFGRPDVWSSANETLRSGRGDCEDYAIAKLQMLRAAGFSQRDLYLVIVRDLVRRADHAILVARAAGHLYVLDDGTDEVLDSNQRSRLPARCSPSLHMASGPTATASRRRRVVAALAFGRSALAQRVAIGLQRRLQKVGQDALASGDDLRVGHHSRA